jgi:hypothetical protein
MLFGSSHSKRSAAIEDIADPNVVWQQLMERGARDHQNLTQCSLADQD